MVTNTTTKWIFITLFFFAMKSKILIKGQEFPCLFFFGDSLMDNGNNNVLLTLVKANYQPYGIDYPGGIPTGRFSNGRNLADFIAQLLGFSTPIRPFASNDSDLLRGVNYASGGGGILDGTGLQLGKVLSFNKQLRNHRTTIERISSFRGNQTAAERHLQQCLYVVNIGTQDYDNNYYFPGSPTRVLYTPNEFADLLVQQLSQQLRTLNSLGARKVVVYGLNTLGCMPVELTRYPTFGSQCVDSINHDVELYNNKVSSLLNDLNTTLADAQFIFVNITDLSSANPLATGTRVNRVGCCKVSITGLCVPSGIVCNNRSEYYYWDNYHPTEFVYKIIATRAYTRLQISAQ